MLRNRYDAIVRIGIFGPGSRPLPVAADPSKGGFCAGRSKTPAGFLRVGHKSNNRNNNRIPSVGTAMKLTIERAALLKSLAHVQSVVERRNTIPILSNVLLDASSNGLTLTATDLDLEIVETVPADVGAHGRDHGAGAYALRHRAQAARRRAGRARTSADAGQLSLRAGRSRFALATLPREDFPAVGGEAAAQVRRCRRPSCAT